MVIKRRWITVLQYLLNINRPVALKELSKMNEICDRTIRYDIDDINCFLKDFGIHIDVCGKGRITLKVTEEEKLKIENKLGSLELKDICLSSQDKINFIIIKLLTASEPITITALAEELAISRTSLNKTMKEVYQWFEDQGIEVVKRTNYGIKLQYTESQWRNTVVNLSNQEEIRGCFYSFLARNCLDGQNKYLNTINYTLPYNFESLFNEQVFYKLVDSISCIEAIMNSKFADSSYIELLIHLTIAIKRIREGKIIDMPSYQLQYLQMKGEYKKSKEFTEYLENEFQIEIPDEEIGYMTLQLLGAKQKSEGKAAHRDDDYLRNIAMNLIMKVESHMEVKVGLDYVEDLVNDLITHLKPAIVRLRNGMLITNPILSVFQSNYKQLFEFTKRACEEIEKEYDFIMLPNDEVVYIAMHIGAALEKTNRHVNGKIKVVIMCASGIGTTKMLSSRLQRQFSELEIIGELSLMDMAKVDRMEADIIITTLDMYIDCKKLVIKVTPLLNDNDIRKIEDILQIKRIAWNENFEVNTKKLLKDVSVIAKKYGVLNDENGFKNELYEYLLKSQQKGKEDYPMLCDIINTERISVFYKARDWEDAVREAGRLLVDSGCATENYTEAMVETVKELGPYIVLTKGLALPHARPEKGALKVAMSLVILAEPINFGNRKFDPVKVVFGLSSVDNNAHLRALADLGKFATTEEKFTELISLKNPQEICNYLSQVCKESEGE